MLASLFYFLRDLAVLAAAIGIARWAWDWHTRAAERRDDAAKAAIADERWRTDMRQWATTVEGRLGRLAEAQLENEARVAVKVRVHKLLHATGDPYLSFAEIESALAQDTGGSGDRAPAVDDLRRVVLELVGDGVIAQLDKDRYFIASEFEAGDEREE